jgi:hypothetical protein
MKTIVEVTKHVIFPFLAMAGATLGLLLYAYFYGGPASPYLIIAIPCVAATLAFFFRRMSKKNCLIALIGGALLAPLCIVLFLTSADPIGAVLFLPLMAGQMGIVLAATWSANQLH